MQLPSDLACSFEGSRSYFDEFLPQGQYHVRATSVELIQARKGTHGLAVELLVSRGSASGRLVRLTLWLVGGALPRAKASLEGLGFGGLELDAVLAFEAFAGLPEAIAHVEHEVSAGQVRQAITILPSQADTRRSGIGVAT